ncbi:MAG: N-acetylmuramoyl-L-alanine amidase, partial [Pseudomonadota bacterium]
KAAAAVLKAEKANAAAPLAGVLGPLFENDPAALESLKQHRVDLFAAPTVGKLVGTCADRLDAGFKETREISGHELPEQLPKKPDAPVFTGKFDGPVITVSEEDVKALAAVSQSEVAIFKSFGDTELKGGVHAVIDTIFNRVVYPSKEFAKSIQKEIERPFQFSALNGIGDWTKLPSPTSEILAITRDYVAARANGLESKIRGATHFFNPRKSDPAWGPYLLAHKVAVYGRENTQNVHFHGFASAQYKPPKPYAISFEGNLHPFRGDGTRLPGAQKLPGELVTGPQSAKTLPDTWKPPANMKRIILHWTAGGHKASGLDRHHYHILVEGDGNLVLGKFSIQANENPVRGGYAAHTRGTNTGSIGISACSMRGAKESPFTQGPSPMTKVQWDTMMAAVADLCRAYNIAVTPQTVLGHGEVQKNIGNKQSGKWDPLKLPWDKSASEDKVGDLIRTQVSQLL